MKGFIYRLIMRIAHKYNWHYAPPCYPDGDTQLWCRWCGFRQTIKFAKDGAAGDNKWSRVIGISDLDVGFSGTNGYMTKARPDMSIVSAVVFCPRVNGGNYRRFVRKQ